VKYVNKVYFGVCVITNLKENLERRYSHFLLKNKRKTLALDKKNVKKNRGLFNLETAVEREKAVEDIYVHREFKKHVVTLGVKRDFLNSLGA